MDNGSTLLVGLYILHIACLPDGPNGRIATPDDWQLFTDTCIALIASAGGDWLDAVSSALPHPICYP